MQLNVFSTDNQKSGFRLQYMEVFNWGTFDEHVHTIKPLGETSLLTGANGSGKTTFVDALLTLIVPEKKHRFYNQSSGSEKKGNRTEESYVLGGYKNINSETTGATTTLYLRENKAEAYSILLANFANEAEQEVTLFQIRYFAGGEMKRMFAIAHKALHIEDDFKPFDLSGNWKKRIDQQYNKGSRKQVEWFEAANKYAQRLVDVLGMQSLQALSLFNQTVGIKVLDNLDDFIRTHMLEPRNMEEVFLDLKKHLGTLLDAQKDIEMAEAQIALLKPIQEHYSSFNSLQIQVKDLSEQLNTAIIWKRYTHNSLLQEALIEGKDGAEKIQLRIEESKQLVEDLIEKERVIKNQIDQNKAGQRLKELENDLIDFGKKREEAEKNQTLFAEWCSTLRLHEKNIDDEAGYNRIIKEANSASYRLEREKRLNDDEEFESKSILNKSNNEKINIETELNILLQSKSNIDGSLVNLRKNMCAALKLDINELPFAGELIQVRPEDYQWVPALEKLLRSFSLRLLIPDKHYKKVTKYINQTNTGTRLVYYHVKEVLFFSPDEGTIYHKLDFFKDHKLSKWVEYQIATIFNYSCIEDDGSLERFEKAITINGLIKNKDRHEKDDRPGYHDPGRYVMGWNNEKKKEALVLRRSNLVELITRSEETLKTCANKDKRLQGQYYALSRIKEFEGFSKLDVAEVQRLIHKTNTQLNQLRQSNNQLKILTTQLESIREQRDARELEKSRLSEEFVLLNERLRKMEIEKLDFSQFLQQITENDKEEILKFQQKYLQKWDTVTLDSIGKIYDEFKNITEISIEKLKDNLNNSRNQLVRCMLKVKNPGQTISQQFPKWFGEVSQLSEEPVHADEYVELLDRLMTENLPKYKKDFENYINDTITYKIGGLNEEMEKWEREIEVNIDKLNHSLSGINFNRLPDTFIQLGKRVVADTNIKSFRNNLKDALPQAKNWQQSGFEEKALHFRQKVQPLIDGLSENEAYRNRVMDVRNWYEFWADERFTNTREKKKTYREMGQLSGGEKPQLTYTILCSAIAYQFGITREGKNSRSLRFIAVDESFSNQDEEKATYLMELCKQLHLQLLVVTPSDKIQIVQDFIAHVHLVQRVQDRHSVLYNMTIKELQAKMNKA